MSRILACLVSYGVRSRVFDDLAKDLFALRFLICSLLVSSDLECEEVDNGNDKNNAGEEGNKQPGDWAHNKIGGSHRISSRTIATVKQSVFESRSGFT